MYLLRRHALAIVFVAVAVTLAVGLFVFARPEYSPPSQGETIKVPPEHPAAYAAGAAGWVWAEGTPGWEAGTMLGKHHDFNVSGVQPIELAAAELAAAHANLDANGVRVLVSSRAGKQGPMAILAAPMLYAQPARTCLLAQLPGATKLSWRCPSATRSPRVLVAAAVYDWSSAAHPLYLVGVARGDVQRVVLDAPGFDPKTLYTRGGSWGQFGFSLMPARAGTRLLVYGTRGLVQTLPLRLAPGEQRVFS